MQGVRANFQDDHIVDQAVPHRTAVWEQQESWPHLGQFFHGPEKYKFADVLRIFLGDPIAAIDPVCLCKSLD